MRHAQHQKHSNKMISNGNLQQQQQLAGTSLLGSSGGNNGANLMLNGSSMLGGLQIQNFVTGSSGLELAGFCSPTGRLTLPSSAGVVVYVLKYV